MSQAQLLRAPDLNLEALRVQSLAFEAFNDYDDEAESAYTLTEIGFLPERHESDVHRFRVFFETKFDRAEDHENTPYRVHLRATGYFVTLSDLQSDQVPAGALVNALTIMYGALRGMIMQSTGAAVHGSIVLPTILMGDVLARSIETDASLAALVSGVVAASDASGGSVAAKRRKKRASKDGLTSR
jgi:preprotein translocase subunit SecB